MAPIPIVPPLPETELGHLPSANRLCQGSERKCDRRQPWQMLCSCHSCGQLLPETSKLYVLILLMQLPLGSNSSCADRSKNHEFYSSTTKSKVEEGMPCRGSQWQGLDNCPAKQRIVFCCSLLKSPSVYVLHEGPPRSPAQGLPKASCPGDSRGQRRLAGGEVE